MVIPNLYYSLIVYLLLTLSLCLEVLYFVVVCSLHYEIFAADFVRFVICIAVYDDIMGLLSYLTIFVYQCLCRRSRTSFSYIMCVTVQNILNTSEPCLFIII
jgi:hypothetical protein